MWRSIGLTLTWCVIFSLSTTAMKALKSVQSADTIKNAVPSKKKQSCTLWKWNGWISALLRKLSTVQWNCLKTWVDVDFERGGGALFHQYFQLLIVVNLFKDGSNFSSERKWCTELSLLIHQFNQVWSFKW